MQCEIAMVRRLEDTCCISFYYHSMSRERWEITKFTDQDINALPAVTECLRDLYII
jgi:hypothetical protein